MYSEGLVLVSDVSTPLPLGREVVWTKGRRRVQTTGRCKGQRLTYTDTGSVVHDRFVLHSFLGGHGEGPRVVWRVVPQEVRVSRTTRVVRTFCKRLGVLPSSDPRTQWLPFCRCPTTTVDKIQVHTLFM